MADLEQGVFDQEPPKTEDEYLAVDIAFKYPHEKGELLCFKRPNKNGTVDTFEQYLRDKELLTDGKTTSSIWDELGARKYIGLTNRNTNRYYKYKARSGATGNTYAFNISAVKAYLSEKREQETDQ